jgi:hypothetical protein
VGGIDARSCSGDARSRGALLRTAAEDPVVALEVGDALEADVRCFVTVRNVHTRGHAGCTGTCHAALGPVAEDAVITLGVDAAADETQVASLVACGAQTRIGPSRAAPTAADLRAITEASVVTLDIGDALEADIPNLVAVRQVHARGSGAVAQTCHAALGSVAEGAVVTVGVVQAIDRKAQLGIAADISRTLVAPTHADPTRHGSPRLAEANLVQKLPRTLCRARTYPFWILGCAEVVLRSVVSMAIETVSRCVVALPLQLVSNELPHGIDECIGIEHLALQKLNQIPDVLIVESIAREVVPTRIPIVSDQIEHLSWSQDRAMNTGNTGEV